MDADKTLAALLRELEERLLRAEVRRSPAVVAELLADEFVEFGSSGRVFDKQQMIDALRRERRLLTARFSISGRAPSRQQCIPSGAQSGS